MTGHKGRFLWLALFAAVLIGVASGAVAYNAGWSNGVARTVALQAVTAQGAAAQGAQAVLPYPYGWYRPWGFGFGPLLFLAFFFLFCRAVLWGGGGRRGWYAAGPHGHYRGCYAGPRDPSSSFDEWHQRAHERMKESSPADDPGRG